MESSSVIGTPMAEESAANIWVASMAMTVTARQMGIERSAIPRLRTRRGKESWHFSLTENR